jgi:deazaflavin-dependent oxidoreductase (nitroreductase family)
MDILMAKTYRVSFWVRASNAMVTVLLRAGVKLGSMTLLTVRGRTSGQPRTTPVALIERDGGRWLVAPFGDVNWVRNLRAAGEATLTRGRRSERITVRELSAEEAAVVLKRTLDEAPAFLRGYFDVTAASPLADFEREAPQHPVFQVSAASASAEDEPASFGTQATPRASAAR